MPTEYGSIKGGFYAASASVTDAAANKVSDWQGDGTVAMTLTDETWLGQNIFEQESFLAMVEATMNFSEMAYQPGSWNKLWGLTQTSGSTLETTPVTGASVYELGNTLTSVPENELLASVEVPNNSSKKFQVWAGAGRVSGSFPVSFARGFWTHDAAFTCTTDADGKIFQFISEN